VPHLNFHLKKNISFKCKNQKILVLFVAQLVLFGINLKTKNFQIKKMIRRKCADLKCCKTIDVFAMSFAHQEVTANPPPPSGQLGSNFEKTQKFARFAETGGKYLE
jgi:hypothetical protein